MLLVLGFFVLAVLSVPLMGGRLSRVADVRIRHRWAVFAGLAVQVVFFAVMPGRYPWLQEGVHMATYGLAVIFLVANRSIPGILVVAAGAATNFAAIAANGGVMPAAPSALRTAGMPPDKGGDFANSAAVEDPKLSFLGDVFAVPESWPLSNVFSVGDVLIAVGTLVALHALSGTRLPGSGAAIAQVARYPTFMRVWLAQTTSNVGDFVYALAMTIVVVEQGRSTWALATVLMIQAGSAAATGLLAGPLVDRVSRRRVMIVADLVRAATVALLLIPGEPAMWHIAVTAAVLGSCGAVFQPALQASIPNLVPSSALVAANALSAMTFNAAVLVGPVLGGLLAAGAGVRIAFGLNVLTFLVSAGLIARTAIPRPASSGRSRGRGFRELGSGLGYVLRVPAARIVTAVTAIAMFATSLRQPVEPVLIMRDLAGTAADLGLAGTAWGLGMVLGSIAAPRVSLDRTRGAVMAASLALLAFAIAAAAMATSVGALVVLWLLAGVGNAIFVVAYETALQEQTPDAFRGRVIAANEATLDLMVVTGVLAGGAAATLLGTRATFMMAGAMLPFAVLAAVRLARPRGNHLRTGLVVESVEVGRHVLVRVSRAQAVAGPALDRLGLRLGPAGDVRSPLPDPAGNGDGDWRAAFALTDEEFDRCGSRLALVGERFEASLPVVRGFGILPPEDDAGPDRPAPGRELALASA